MQDVDVTGMSPKNRADVLKTKAIKSYIYFLERLSKGYKDDYSDIINIMLYLDMPYDNKKDNKIFEYLINI